VVDLEAVAVIDVIVIAADAFPELHEGNDGITGIDPEEEIEGMGLAVRE